MRIIIGNARLPVQADAQKSRDLLEPWALKAREPGVGFLGRDDAGHLMVCTKSSAALEFTSQEDAEKFRNSISPAKVANAWSHRAPQLLPVQLGGTSFIVPAWARVFHFLGCISFFWVVRRCFPRATRPHIFVEIWVLLWGVAALTSLLTVGWEQPTPAWLTLILTIVGTLRVAEIVIYQIDMVILAKWRPKQTPNPLPYAVYSYRRSVILTLHNYIEILVWFATFYAIRAACFHTQGLSLKTVSGAIYYSMLNMTTLGYGDIYPLPGESGAAFLVTAQTLIGVFLAVVVLARVIALVPRPLTMDEDEDV